MSMNDVKGEGMNPRREKISTGGLTLPTFSGTAAFPARGHPSMMDLNLQFWRNEGQVWLTVISVTPRSERGGE